MEQFFRNGRVKENAVALVLAIITFLAGVGLSEVGAVSLSKQCDEEKYHYINQMLVCDYRPRVDKSDYTTLRNSLNEFISGKKKKGEVTEVAVYFRDLQFGPTFGINGYAKFSPASLLKLPMMIAILKLGEEDTAILTQTLAFENQIESIQDYFPPKVSIRSHTEYSVQELVEAMIKYSDNMASYTLFEYLRYLSPQEDLLRKTYIDLGIVDPQDGLDQTITVKSYATILVQLYNTSIFNKKTTSETALDILTRSDFNEGLAGGVPKDVVVANKFGERSDLGDNIKQLHDCGIIYYPHNPYALCVMTRGYDFDTLADTIKTVSRMAYNEFDSRKVR